MDRVPSERSNGDNLATFQAKWLWFSLKECSLYLANYSYKCDHNEPSI